MENADMTTFYTTFESPLGPLLLMSDGQSLTGLHTDSEKHRPALRPDWIRDEAAAPFAEVKTQLRAYFEGRLTEFDLPLAPQGTEFQLCVWHELRGIPYGETISYAELAHRIGQAQASRAVGHANARNPISIIVPCHRVIGADNSLTGYAGGWSASACCSPTRRQSVPHVASARVCLDSSAGPGALPANGRLRR
jgi:methylated-DNA-[protein]-cysteine S-methyltransferase